MRILPQWPGIPRPFTFAQLNSRVVGMVDGDTMKGKVALGELGDGTFIGKEQPKE